MVKLPKLAFLCFIFGVFFSLAADCGELEPIDDEPRTSVPWIVGIFLKSNTRSNFKFLVTGVVLGPTTVMTVAGGAYGSPSKGAKSRYSIGPLANFLIGAGLKSTNLTQRDKHSQFSEVINYFATRV